MDRAGVVDLDPSGAELRRALLEPVLPVLPLVGVVRLPRQVDAAVVALAGTTTLLVGLLRVVTA